MIILVGQVTTPESGTVVALTLTLTLVRVLTIVAVAATKLVNEMVSVTMFTCVTERVLMSDVVDVSVSVSVSVSVIVIDAAV